MFVDADRRVALDPAARGTHLKRWTLRTDLVARGAPFVALALLVMTIPNLRFGAPLARQGGARLAHAGVPLRPVHYLTAAASVPASWPLWTRRRG